MGDNGKVYKDCFPNTIMKDEQTIEKSEANESRETESQIERVNFLDGSCSMDELLAEIKAKMKAEEDDRERVTILSRDESMILAGMMSDMQEEFSGDYGEFDKDRKRNMTGKLNLIKGVLFGTLEMVSEDGFSWSFKSKKPNSRFCDKCGLVKSDKYSNGCTCLKEAN